MNSHSLEAKIKNTMVETWRQSTKYFHRIATTHKRVNSIDNLKVDGIEVTDAEEIKEAIQIRQEPI